MRKETTFEANDGGTHLQILEKMDKLDADLNKVVLRSLVKLHRYYLVNKENYLTMDKFRFVIEETLGDIVRDEMEYTRRMGGIRTLLQSAIHNKQIDDIVSLTEEMNVYLNKYFGTTFRMTEYLALKHHDYLRTVLFNLAKTDIKVHVRSVNLIDDKELITDLLIIDNV